MASLHFSPPFYCDGPMAHPAWPSLGRSAQHRVGYACAGFSLLEVLVAFAILAVSLAVILQIFSTGLRAGVLSDDYSHAISLAESKLTEIGAVEVLEEAGEVGEFDERFRWRTTIQLLPGWEEEEGPLLPLRPYQVTVEVFWGEANRERSVSLVTLRLAAST